ncbi:unnamed protein product [Rhizopus stolonifer]
MNSHFFIQANDGLNKLERAVQRLNMRDNANRKDLTTSEEALQQNREPKTFIFALFKHGSFKDPFMLIFTAKSYNSPEGPYKLTVAPKNLELAKLQLSGLNFTLQEFDIPKSLYKLIFTSLAYESLASCYTFNFTLGERRSVGNFYTLFTFPEDFGLHLEIYKLTCFPEQIPGHDAHMHENLANVSEYPSEFDFSLQNTELFGGHVTATFTAQEPGVFQNSYGFTPTPELSRSSELQLYLDNQEHHAYHTFDFTFTKLTEEPEDYHSLIFILQKYRSLLGPYVPIFSLQSPGTSKEHYTLSYSPQRFGLQGQEADLSNSPYVSPPPEEHILSFLPPPISDPNAALKGEYKDGGSFVLIFASQSAEGPFRLTICSEHGFQYPTLLLFLNGQAYARTCPLDFSLEMLDLSSFPFTLTFILDKLESATGPYTIAFTLQGFGTFEGPYILTSTPVDFGLPEGLYKLIQKPKGSEWPTPLPKDSDNVEDDNNCTDNNGVDNDDDSSDKYQVPTLDLQEHGLPEQAQHYDLQRQEQYNDLQMYEEFHGSDSIYMDYEASAQEQHHDVQMYEEPTQEQYYDSQMHEESYKPFYTNNDYRTPVQAQNYGDERYIEPYRAAHASQKLCFSEQPSYCTSQSDKNLYKIIFTLEGFNIPRDPFTLAFVSPYSFEIAPEGLALPYVPLYYHGQKCIGSCESNFSLKEFLDPYTLTLTLHKLQSCIGEPYSFAFILMDPGSQHGSYRLTCAPHNLGLPDGPYRINSLSKLLKYIILIIYEELI